ncbi:MAG: DUF2914 domain-containing protein [bacterium]
MKKVFVVAVAFFFLLGMGVCLVGAQDSDISKDEVAVETEDEMAVETEDANAVETEDGLSSDKGKVSELAVELKLGTGIEEREVVGESEIFDLNVSNKVYCWSCVKGAEEPTKILHKWYYGDNMISEISLNIAYPRHRTWSYKTITPDMAGAWKVEVIDNEGNLLGVKAFSVK